MAVLETAMDEKPVKSVAVRAVEGAAVLAAVAFAAYKLVSNNSPWWVWLLLLPMAYYFLVHRLRQE